MRLIGKVVAAVLLIAFLVALGGDSKGATTFGNNAVKAGGVVINIGVQGAMTLASVLSNTGKKPAADKPAA